jgi:hypothetical protein
MESAECELTILWLISCIYEAFLQLRSPLLSLPKLVDIYKQGACQPAISANEADAPEVSALAWAGLIKKNT